MMTAPTAELRSASCSVQVDDISSQTWNEALSEFDDFCIYNTWDYERALHPRSKVSRLLIRRDGNVVGAVQARIAEAAKRGLAFIRWGPVWRRDGVADPSVFRDCLRAIYSEYAVKRRLLVRLIPQLLDYDRAWALPILEEEGFQLCTHQRTRRTIIMDLEPTMDELFDNLHGKWRGHLKRARRRTQSVSEGTGDEFFERFKQFYDGMRERKGFESFTDFNGFRQLQKVLPEDQKLIVVLCGDGSEYYSGAIVSSLGTMGYYLFGATNGKGLENKGSYLVQWRVLELLKEHGCRTYDLNGINPEENPTTYMYKARLGGKNRKELEEIGMFEAASDPISRGVVRPMLHLVEAWRQRKLRRAAQRIKQPEQDDETE
jgi:lipid II:glycine glycyltransferase (peptidoglycan interpeptide bridge formation enzyme)